MLFRSRVCRAGITVVDPATNAPATGIHSIPLTGPADAMFAEIGIDGCSTSLSAGRPQSRRAGCRSRRPEFRGLRRHRQSGVQRRRADLRQLGERRAAGIRYSRRRVIRGAGNGIAIPNNSGGNRRQDELRDRHRRLRVGQRRPGRRARRRGTCSSRLSGWSLPCRRRGRQGADEPGFVDGPCHHPAIVLSAVRYSESSRSSD